MQIKLDRCAPNALFLWGFAFKLCLIKRPLLFGGLSRFGLRQRYRKEIQQIKNEMHSVVTISISLPNIYVITQAAWPSNQITHVHFVWRAKCLRIWNKYMTHTGRFFYRTAGEPQLRRNRLLFCQIQLILPCNRTRLTHLSSISKGARLVKPNNSSQQSLMYNVTRRFPRCAKYEYLCVKLKDTGITSWSKI